MSYPLNDTQDCVFLREKLERTSWLYCNKYIYTDGVRSLIRETLERLTDYDNCYEYTVCGAGYEAVVKKIDGKLYAEVFGCGPDEDKLKKDYVKDLEHRCET